MGFSKELVKTAINYFLREDTDRNTQKNDFTGLEYDRETMEHLWYQPVKGLGIFDRAGTQDKYRSYAYAAINKTAMNIAKAEYFIYREYKSKTTEIKDHPLLKVFRSENIYGETYSTTLYLTTIFLKIKGEAFWHIVFTKSPFGKVVSEIRLLFGCTEVVMNKENTLVEHYKNGNIIFQKDEIIHLKHPNPNNRFAGSAPVNAFNFTLDIDFLQNRTSRSMFDNNANLEGVVMFPTKVDPTNKQVLKQQFKEEFTGSKGKQGDTLFIDNGAKYERIQANAREMDFRNSRLQVRDEIFVILDVPKTVMNVSDDVNYSNSQSALRSWLENSLQPFCKVVISDPLNSFFRKIYGDRFLLTMEYEFEVDRQMQLNTYDLYLRHKVIKKEKIAEMEGFSPEDVPEEAEPILEPKILEDEAVET